MNVSGEEKYDLIILKKYVIIYKFSRRANFQESGLKQLHYLKTTVARTNLCKSYKYVRAKNNVFFQFLRPDNNEQYPKAATKLFRSY